MSRGHPILGLSVYGVIFINALTHIGEATRFGYNTGVLTALILFIPSSLWVMRTCFGRQGLPYRALAFILLDGVILHVILLGTTLLYIHHVIGPSALVVIQVLNAVLFFVMAWLAERWRGGVLLQHAAKF